MESLRGIFPQTQPPPKRDFLKENVQRIKNMQISRKPSSEYSNNFSNKPKPRKLSLCENNRMVSRSTNSLSLCPTKAPIHNLRKSISTENHQKEMGTQTVDTGDDYFLKDSIIRYPSASTLRTASRPPSRTPSAHHTQTCSRGHQMEPSEEPRTRFLSRKDHGRDDKFERHISNLNEFMDRGYIKKRPSSILKNSSSNIQKSNKDYINESQQQEDRKTEKIKQQTIEISDDDDVQKETISPTEKELGAGDTNKQQLKAAEEDPDCPEGHVPLPENERLEALKLAKKRFKELVDDLNRLPMTCETLRVRNRKIEIEKELRALEINMRVFSRPKVYVKLN